MYANEIYVFHVRALKTVKLHTHMTNHQILIYKHAALHIIRHPNDGHNIYRNMLVKYYEGWNFNSGNHLFTTDTK